MKYPHNTAVYAQLRAAIREAKGAPDVPPKDIEEPAAAHIKEVETTHATSDSGWDIPEEGQTKKRHPFWHWRELDRMGAFGSL